MHLPCHFPTPSKQYFQEYLDNFIIVYLDNILIFSATVELHWTHVKKVFTILRDHGLYVKAEKCDYEKTVIQFLGLIISMGGFAMDPQKVKAILEWPAPLIKWEFSDSWASPIFIEDL